MAMTIDQIAGMLEDLDLTYQHQDGYLFFTMETQTYRDPEKSGNKALTLMIELMEDGEFSTLVAPRAYFVRGRHQDAFLRACARVQWRTKLVQFEWDVRDGEVRPIIELPLEDASLTRRQLQRCIHALCSIVDRYHEVLHRAASEGVVELPGDDPAEGPAAGASGSPGAAGAVAPGDAVPYCPSTPGDVGIPVDFSQNYWGTTDVEEIAAGIWDRQDADDSINCVTFLPLADGPVRTEPHSWSSVKSLFEGGED